MNSVKSFAAPMVRALRVGLALVAIGVLGCVASADSHVYITAGSNPGELTGATIQNPYVFDNAGFGGAQRLVGFIDAYGNLLDPASMEIIGYVYISGD